MINYKERTDLSLSDLRTVEKPSISGQFFSLAVI